jgi:hypothetical protein
MRGDGFPSHSEEKEEKGDGTGALVLVWWYPITKGRVPITF